MVKKRTKMMPGLAALVLALALALSPLTGGMGSAAAAEWGAWSDWSADNPGSSGTRQVESRSVVTGYNMFVYQTQEAASPYNRVFRDYSINGDYSGHGARSSYGEFLYTCTASKAELDGSARLEPGGYGGSGQQGYNRGNRTAYCMQGRAYFIQSEITQTQYRYRDQVATPPPAPTPIRADDVGTDFYAVVANANGYFISPDGNFDRESKTARQVLYFQRGGSNLYHITTADRAASLDAAANESGATVYFFNGYHGRTNQQWRIQNNGGAYYLSAQSSPGTLLDLNNGDQRLRIWDTNKGVCQTFSITKVNPVSALSFSNTSIGLKVGETAALSSSLQIAPANAYNPVPVYSSGNASVASVSAAGVVTANREGTAVITAASVDGLNKSAAVTVSVTAVAPVPPPISAAQTYTKVEYDGHQYQIFDEAMSWAQAKARAEQLGGHLATITSLAEQNFINSLFKPIRRTNYWLGGTDTATEGVWTWITGEAFSYQNWDSGQPDNTGNQDYLVLWPNSGGRWDDGDNNNPADFGFICEWEPAPAAISAAQNYAPAEYDGHQYQILDEGLTWERARTRAEQLGGHLATITSQAEQSFVNSLFKPVRRSNYWLGGTDTATEGVWTWITGEAFGYQNWDSGQPDNSGNQDYLALRPNSGGRWDDGDNNNTADFGFICEWETEPLLEPKYEPVIPPENKELLVVSAPSELELTVTVTPIGVDFSWTPSGNPFGYRIYRSAAPGGAGLSISDFPLKGSSFFDANAEPDTRYYYTIAAITAETSFDPVTKALISEQIGPRSEEISVLTAGIKTDPTKVHSFILMKIDDPIMQVNESWMEIDPGRGTAPIITNGRTMVPIRAIVEAMGGKVDWDEGDKRATLAYGGRTVEMWLDRKDVTVNGAGEQMDIAPYVSNDRILLPIRFVAENLGCQIEWISSLQKVVIVYNRA
ncbi:MAG: Ig-like domain-containing protein [Clostridiales bacterium]|nr:Ig-like domain-containing protein [Clostridiales bacterium]